MRYYRKLELAKARIRMVFQYKQLNVYITITNIHQPEIG
jgi:hypothetical protein